MRRTGRLAAALTLALGISALAQPEAGQRPRVVVAELDGIIHPIAAEYVAEVIDRADTSGAALVVVILRTPGGLLDSTREIVSRMIISRAPVVVFVTPSGGRAASAGFVLAMAADIAAMSPGTHIGAAHPVSGTGGDEDSTTADKAASDAAAYVRTLAAARHRNVALAEEAVLKSRAFTETEARDASPPLIDMVVPDLEGLLRQLDGRSVERFDGRKSTLALADAEIERVPMSWRQRFLGALAHPQIAYLLLILGLLGLTVELWNPGAIAPGVAGGLCLLLAFFALQILPLDTTGLLLVVFGLGLLLVELQVPSFGVFGIGGTVSLVIGSVMLTRTVPGVDVPLRFVVPVALSLAGILVFVGRLALESQRRPPVTGLQGLVGVEGRARTALRPGDDGQVDVRGEIWRAAAAVPINPGTPVRVVAVNGLTLTVDPVGASPRQGAQ